MQRNDRNKGERRMAEVRTDLQGKANAPQSFCQ